MHRRSVNIPATEIAQQELQTCVLMLSICWAHWGHRCRTSNDVGILFWRFFREHFSTFPLFLFSSIWGEIALSSTPKNSSAFLFLLQTLFVSNLWEVFDLDCSVAPFVGKEQLSISDWVAYSHNRQFHSLCSTATSQTGTFQQQSQFYRSQIWAKTGKKFVSYLFRVDTNC